MTHIQVGMHFHHDDAIFECLAITECSARCRSKATREVTVEDRDGATRRFVARVGRTVHLAPRSMVAPAS